MALVAILGSAFDAPALAGKPLVPREVATREGPVVFHEVSGTRGKAHVLFRHGLPHRFLPHQIPYLAAALGLRELGCRGLLVTSSAGVLDEAIPLFTPLLVRDLFMPENRLPDGRTCTVFQHATEDQGHLVLEEGLFSRALGAEIERLAAREGTPVKARVTFAYAGGPRTKTPAENAWLRAAGAQVNSMTVGPEVVLANELGIPVAALVVGHKYSVPGRRDPLDEASLRASLVAAKHAVEKITACFLDEAEAPAFANRLYRF